MDQDRSALRGSFCKTRAQVTARRDPSSFSTETRPSRAWRLLSSGTRTHMRSSSATTRRRARRREPIAAIK
jgi:hypothetical protein